MKFTLKDYQEEAVGNSLERLWKASKRWKEDGDIHAFSLTATTGAGKTVMAAAVFEALFYGDDNFNFELDPTATVIWFSDDPSLNEQSRFRLLEASDKLDYSDLVVVENSFNQEKFQPGKIYFLNTQKLSKTSLLTRGHVDSENTDSDQLPLYPDIRPDNRAFTIWDTIKNTIQDEKRTLYLLLDEAHRGMGKRSDAVKKEKSTIVKNLINGSGDVPPIPIVWGISATVERFNNAVEDAKNRSTLPNVIVDSEKVQNSGLLKDTIILDFPDNTGQVDNVLVRRGAKKLKEITEAWQEYSRNQGEDNLVVPLMVIQVPNNPNKDDVGRALDTVFKEWEEIDVKSVAHVFGEHTVQTFGAHKVEYIAPQRVQETSNIRILIAKDAISTGWDCPRAEVMVSFRPAKDKTHITQLLGRMVRTPLARRIPGNDRLNAVECLLPAFDRKTVEIVADTLMNGGTDDGSGGIPGRRVLIKPIEVNPNDLIPQEIWELFENLPSQELPKTHSKPVKRLTALAQELATDKILEDAGKKAHSELHIILDAARTRFSKELETSKKQVLEVKVNSLVTDLNEQEKSFNDYIENADFEVINNAYRNTARIISPDLAKTYAEYLAHLNKDEEDFEEALFEARIEIASLGLVNEIQEYLESEADKISKKWLNDYRVEIKNLKDERRDAYRILKSWSKEPMDFNLEKPIEWMVPTILLENEKEIKLTTFQKHLMSDNSGFFPCHLNSWEQDVLNKELSRPGNLGWYRNPSNATQDSLGISYIQDEKFSIMRPDFIFFARNNDNSVVADIIDPHSHHLSDALPKLLGLVSFAKKYGKNFRRIEAITKIDDKLRYLDIMNPEIQTAVKNTESVKILFEGEYGSDY
ncbi:DEAD/DEAH box helicase family protein [Gramella sp. GC03-9]|uniref:DEAD/DEAH box helicase family protein n=1 Tax=Christiangramia oceanisediminis TaxID=2920386 RepID=A0A9X2I145_9FLAO|nr:DEAD/DEAH box helicase family protein [Gramella oceanisediminis]MCP9199016.1 DEAD/DEAH box helicase family protein [Gramella oceanisediminis]